jgi:hypothetical protein
MTLSRKFSVDGFGWSRLLLLLAILSLTLTLASRFSFPVSSQAHAVKSVDSRSSEPKRQHLDQDAARLAEQAASCNCEKLVVLHPYIVPSEPMRSDDILSFIFNNRPPPSSL